MTTDSLQKVAAMEFFHVFLFQGNKLSFQNKATLKKFLQPESLCFPKKKS